MSHGRCTAALTLAALLAAGCAPAPAPEAPPPRTAADVVDSVIASPPLSRAHWGVRVRPAAGGPVLYGHQPDKHFRPASNMKLLVTAAAMDLLGPDHRYRTPIHVMPGAADSVAAGILIVGRGDPTLSERYHESDLAPVRALADSIAAAGVRRVDGDIIIDATYFDTVRVNPAWETGDLSWYYAAPVAPFAVAEAAVPIRVAPGPAPSEPAVLAPLVPPGLVTFVNRLATDTAGADRALDVDRRPHGDTIVVAGRVPLDRSPDTLWIAAPEPAAYAGRALALALEDRGVPVTGRVRVVTDSADAAALRRAALATAGPRITWTSPPLAEIVAGILGPSQNWMAEQLLKTLGALRGAGGSWPAGIDVEREWLFETVGIDSAAVYIRDASGLAAQNLLTPDAVVRLLAYARRSPWGEAYRDALPGAAEPETTLEHRLSALEGRLFAKTGTITHVNALSGYLETGRGELLFSILTDASGLPSGRVRDAIDRIVRAIEQEGSER